MALTWKSIHFPSNIMGLNLGGFSKNQGPAEPRDPWDTVSTAVDLSLDESEGVLALHMVDEAGVKDGVKAFPGGAGSTPSSSSSSPGTTPAVVSMDREDHHVAWSIVYCVSFLLMEVGKQCSSYAMKYYNNEVYPVPQTFLVAAVEGIKLGTMVTVLVIQGKLFHIKISLWFALPSIIYGVTNNIHFYALHLTSPPVWTILMQMRVVFIAVTYRVVFKKQITRMQWFALAVLITGITVTKIGGGVNKGNFIHPTAWMLAAFTSVLCMIAAVLTEYLFKNDRRQFVDQQLQLYLFGTLVTLVICLMETKKDIKDLIQFNGVSDNTVLVMVVTCVTLSVTSGLSVAVIMKKMDNIVKIYCGALATLLTAVVSSVFFSNRFTIDWTYAAGFVLVFTAIFLYEKKDIDWGETVVGNFMARPVNGKPDLQPV